MYTRKQFRQTIIVHVDLNFFNKAGAPALSPSRDQKKQRKWRRSKTMSAINVIYRYDSI